MNIITDSIYGIIEGVIISVSMLAICVIIFVVTEYFGEMKYGK